MPNKYASSIRTYIARNVGEGTISPPGDFAVAPAAWLFQYFNFARDLNDYPFNRQGNIHIHRVGLFSNFADGLVPAHPYTRLNLRIWPGYLDTVGVAKGTATWASNSKTITGIGTTWDTPGAGQINVGDTILLQDYPHLVTVVTSDISLEVSDYPRGTEAVGAAIEVHQVALNSVELQCLDIMNLNHLYQVDWFFPIAILGFVPGTVYQPIFQASVDASDPTRSMTWHTDSISADYDGDDVMFDMVAEFEITPVVMAP